jgi:hypothetical protein
MDLHGTTNRQRPHSQIKLITYSKIKYNMKISASKNELEKKGFNAIQESAS